MTRKKVFFKSLACFILLFAFASALPFNTLKSFADSNDVQFDTFTASYYRLLRLYLKPLNPDELIRGAVKGMNIALAHGKIAYTVHPPNLTQDTQEDLNLFHQVFVDTAENVKVKDKMKIDDLMTNALRGMFEATGDPYTVYMTPREFKSLSEQMNGGDFGGIGIYIDLEKGTRRLIVVDPIEDTPAWRAGLKAGDYIDAIDSKSTKGISLDEAQKEIRGPIGSQVTLIIRRKGETGQKEYAITRGLVRVKSVSYKMLDGNIAYLRLRIFGEHTGDELQAAMQELEAKGAKAYILDLRNNGGGYIDAAKEVCSKFLPRGDIVVSVRNRLGQTQTDYADGNRHPLFPLTVLVNEFSASASEITAGALQDYHRGKIVGTRTFGKGSVQTIISDLPNGGAIKITIAHYETPSGRDINKKGITPDVIVPMQGHSFETSDDIQLQKAIALLKGEMATKTGMQ